jgi:hypothetical protein
MPVVRIDGIAGLGANAGLTLSGHQTSIEFGTLTTAPGSEINFALDVPSASATAWT